MAHKRLILVLLFQLTGPHFLLSYVQGSAPGNGSEPIQARDDESENKPSRPSVKKWFNSLLANSPGGKKSATSGATSSAPAGSSNASVSPTSSSPPSAPSSSGKPYIVPVPVPMATPALYPYPMSYSAMPYMAYPYSPSRSRSAVLPLTSMDMSPYPLMASDSPRSKGRYALHPSSFPQAGLYMASPHVSPYGYDSQGFAYAIPVPLLPYVKSNYPHSRPAKYRSKMKSMKPFQEKSPHLEPMSDSDESSNAVESQNKELFTPSFEATDHMEPFEEAEYTNEAGHEEYENESERGKL